MLPPAPARSRPLPLVEAKAPDRGRPTTLAFAAGLAACSPYDTVSAVQDESLTVGARVTGRLSVTVRDEQGAVQTLGIIPVETVVDARGAAVTGSLSGVPLNVLVVVSETRSATAESALGRLARTPEVSRKTLLENGQAHTIQVTRMHARGPILEMRHSINGELAFVTSNEWRSTPGGWILGRSILAQYLSGGIVREMVTEVADVQMSAASIPDVLMDRLEQGASLVASLLLPGEAHAQGPDCGAELTIMVAAAWGSKIACAGGLALFTPPCGAALLAYTGASWAWANCINQEPE